MLAIVLIPYSISTASNHEYIRSAFVCKNALYSDCFRTEGKRQSSWLTGWRTLSFPATEPSFSTLVAEPGAGSFWHWVLPRAPLRAEQWRSSPLLRSQRRCAAPCWTLFLPDFFLAKLTGQAPTPTTGPFPFPPPSQPLPGETPRTAAPGFIAVHCPHCQKTVAAALPTGDLQAAAGREDRELHQRLSELRFLCEAIVSKLSCGGSPLAITTRDDRQTADRGNKGKTERHQEESDHTDAEASGQGTHPPAGPTPLSQSLDTGTRHPQ